jgi:hypothetical protein
MASAAFQLVSQPVKAELLVYQLHLRAVYLQTSFFTNCLHLLNDFFCLYLAVNRQVRQQFLEDILAVELLSWLNPITHVPKHMGWENHCEML